MEFPLVSILCGCYNQGKFIVDALDSIKAQTCQNFEVIIWDDASTDNSVEVIEYWMAKNSHLIIKLIKHKENKGICISLNESYHISKGKYIQLLALDDLLLPWKLQEHVEILEKAPEDFAMVFTDAYMIDDAGKEFQNKFIAYHKQYLSLESGNFLNELIIGNFIPAMSVLYRRSAIEDVGTWDEELVYEDYDMLLRLSRKYDFIFSEKPSVKYRMHAHNTHKTMSQPMQMASFKLLLKHSEIPEVYNKLRRIVEEQFTNNRMTTEAELLFQKHKTSKKSEKILLENGNKTLYRLVKKYLD